MRPILSRSVFTGASLFTVFLGMFALLPIARAAEPVTSNDFRLVGPDGKLTAEWTTSREGTPSIFMYDQAGRVRLNFALYPDGAPGLILNDDQGRAAAILRLAESEGKPVLVFKEGGQDKLIVGLHPLSVLSPDGYQSDRIVTPVASNSGFATLGIVLASLIAGLFGGALAGRATRRTV